MLVQNVVYSNQDQSGSGTRKCIERGTMAEQVQKSKSTQKREEVLEEDVKTETKEDSEQLKADTDDFLDEIDSVLDTEFDVSQYIQKGGE